MLKYQESFLVSSKDYKMNNNNSNNNKQLIILQQLLYGRHGANCWETVIIQPILEMRKFCLLLGHEVRWWESWVPAQTLKTRASDLNHPSVCFLTDPKSAFFNPQPISLNSALQPIRTCSYLSPNHLCNKKDINQHLLDVTVLQFHSSKQ